MLTIKEFKSLSQDEKSMLLKFPALISLLAANTDGKMDVVEKKEAIRLTHIKTFSCEPQLSDFYQEAERVFPKMIDDLNSKLTEDKKQRTELIKKELTKLEPILLKLGDEYAMAMYRSMKSYTRHVSKAHDNILDAFIIPFYIKGLTD